MFCCLMVVGCVGVVYLLSLFMGVSDISINGNLLGWCVYVSFILGFDGVWGMVMLFYGCVNSYIEFLNCGSLDISSFIMLMVWISYFGCVGLIFNYMLNGWGVYFWMVNLWMLFVCFMCWSGSCFMFVVFSCMVCYCVWNYVGCMYDYCIGIVSFFVGNSFVVFCCIGCISFVINYLVSMGVSIGDGSYFWGSIFCM